MISFIRMLALLMAGVTFINGGIISGKTAGENYESKDRNSQANIVGEQIRQKQRHYKIISLANGKTYNVTGKEQVARIDKIVSSLNMWEDSADLSNRQPLYQYICYQQKTLQNGQDPNENRDYEEIETILVYPDSSYITLEINPAAVHNMRLPQKLLSFTFKISAEESNYLKDMTPYQ